MKDSVSKLIRLYVLLVTVFVVGKLVFMFCYRDMYAGCTVPDVLSVVWHGLRLDGSVAGYLSVVPGLVLAVSFWLRDDGRIARWLLRGYFLTVAAVIAAVAFMDTALYEYWGFKLDMTPVFYFMSSPTAAMASVSGWLIVVGTLAYAVVLAVLYMLMNRWIVRGGQLSGDALTLKSRLKGCGMMLLLTALLFVPIRGSFSVAPVNLSSAYFSDNVRLNHAAVNPAFSLLYSATHQQNFGRSFRFMESEDAADKMACMTDTVACEECDTLLRIPRPDVYIIIMESFSSHLLPSQGGEPIATGLDSIASTGLLFDRFYACSFRTDRALPAILAGYPSQPTTSLMKYVEKTENLPSIPKSLKRAGYETRYYYGGDADFTNMKAFLVSAGFDCIVSDKDFPAAERTGKWGVHDGVLFDRCFAEIEPYDSVVPRLRVVQTSSSHEPFEVPYRNARLTDPAVNAFVYADSCVTAFVDRLASLPVWDSSLVIIVPDHYGCYPHDLEPMDVDARHRVPMILTGGALVPQGRSVHTVGAQTDIAATLLDMLGIDRSEFLFSHNLLCGSDSVRFGYVSTPTYAAIVTAGGNALYDIERDSVTETGCPELGGEYIKAYLQSLYDDLDRL